MSRLGDALRTFSKVYHEAAPVSQGDCHDESLSEAPGEYFPTHGGGDASGKMVYPGGRKGDGPRGLRDTGRSHAPEAEGDSRRGARSDGFPVDKSDPGDPMDPGYNGEPLDQGRSKVNIRCPHCDEKNTVRLPKHLTVVRSAYAGEGEAYASEGKILRTKCGKCAEMVRFHAPEGHRFVRRTGEAQRHFAQRYRYLTGRGGNPITRGIRSAREAFRRSYFGR